MRFYITGDEVNRPAQLRRLPLSLYRDQNYPGQPEFMADAAQRYLAGDQVPIYVPARMMLTQYTDAAAQFGGSTVAMLQALKQSRETRERLHELAMRGVPVQDFYAAANARTGNQLPMGSPNPKLSPGYIPAARNALPPSAFISPDELVAALRRQDPLP